MAVVESNPEDRKIISILNEKRKEIIGSKLSGAYQEIQKLNTKLSEQMNHNESLENDKLQLEKKLVSESELNTGVINKLQNESHILSNELTMMQNEKMETDNLIKELRKSTRLLLNEIQELKVSHFCTSF